MPDRLPSLVLLVGCWIPPVVIGLTAANLVHRSTVRVRPALIHMALVAFAVMWAATWFFFQLNRIPPYVPGATMDPTYAPPEAIKGLFLVSSALVLPVSIIAGMLSFRWRRRSMMRASAAPLSA